MVRLNDYHKIGLLIAAIILICDLVTKQFFQNLLFDPPRSIEILPFLNFTAVWNKGVSFGLMSGAEIWHLLAIATAITGVILYWLWQAHDRWTAGGCGLILGGAIGNIYDRIQFGAVRDFFDFYVGQYHWPAFNIADSAVFIGVIFLLFSSAKRPDKIAS